MDARKNADNLSDPSGCFVLGGILTVGVLKWAVVGMAGVIITSPPVTKSFTKGISSIIAAFPLNCGPLFHYISLSDTLPVFQVFSG